ncbi:MAG: DUF1858 domain-containing protein [candidate division WOR-3 bacterium]|nr:MAG: DUF1858 domain-containing protein [candidate division WOR-3 bacterium]
MKKITADTHIDQILSRYPTLSRVFIEYGLPCLVCGEPFWGTVEQLGKQYDMNVCKLIEKLNEEKGKSDEKT